MDIKPTVEERKSIKYKSFPNAAPGIWGPKVREKHYDKLHEAILARIKHVSGRIDQYLPPYNKNYNVDQSLALDLENSFDELAQLYLKCAQESYGGYFYPKNKDEIYSYEPIKVFDEKLEKIYDLIIKAEDPLFKEKQGNYLIDPEAKLADTKYKDYSEQEKNTLHEQGVNMLKEALDKIQSLRVILESRSPLAS